MILWVLTQKYKFESNSQQKTIIMEQKINCEFSHKNTNLKAIHNKAIDGLVKDGIVSSHTKIQIWKQFTTKENIGEGVVWLWVLTQKYKFESNSQQEAFSSCKAFNCEFSHKNTNLKAIHNDLHYNWNKPVIVSSHTKIQIWKQFTTLF